jgi:hypothetical protein
MKSSAPALIIVTAIMVLLSFASPSTATPITYQQTGIASGMIGATPFTNAFLTVTLTADTSTVSNVMLFPGPDWLVNVGTTTTVNIQGIGTATITQPTAIYSSVVPFADATMFGLPVLPYVLIGTLDHPPATNSQTSLGGLGSTDLLGYELQTSIGPITGSPGGVFYDPCCFVTTTLGNLSFLSNLVGTDQGTFTATTVPEPSTLLLLGAGAVVLAGSRLRQRSR